MSASEADTRPSRGSRVLNVAFTAALIVAIILLILELIPANSYLFLPGEALPVAPMISVKGFPQPHGPGRLLMTDVSLAKVDHLLEELYGRLNPDAELEPANQVAPNMSTSQFNQLNVQLMTDSVHQAEAAALNAVPGYHARCAPGGPAVYQTVPGKPAASQLKLGDLIAQVDGQTVRCASDVGRLIKRHRPGQLVRLTVSRGKRVLHLVMPTVAATETAGHVTRRVAIIGVVVQDRFSFPVKISINVGDIGGPSAGMMFALGIIQVLERHDLTHGCVVAGTGTIDSSGNVGPIGGAKQKIIAARRAGARYFLVPDAPDNVGPARSARGDVQVIPVKTLRQALTFLQHLKPCR